MTRRASFLSLPPILRSTHPSILAKVPSTTSQPLGTATLPYSSVSSRSFTTPMDTMARRRGRLPGPTMVTISQSIAQQRRVPTPPPLSRDDVKHEGEMRVGTRTALGFFRCSAIGQHS